MIGVCHKRSRAGDGQPGESPSHTLRNPDRRDGRRRDRKTETVGNRYRKQQEESGRGEKNGL